VEQREGRILRQGNTNEEVSIYRYVTEGSFDAYMWQALETKARFISQVITGDSTVRSGRQRILAARSYRMRR
jgi:SNF2 family DNA or RNA helicase